MPRARLVLYLAVVVAAPWFAAIGCGGVSNPTDEAVVIIQEPALPEGEAAAEGTAPAP